MKLTTKEQNKLIDIIVLLNSRFTKLFSKSLEITRQTYTKNPFVKANIDNNPDHSEFLEIIFHFNLTNNNDDSSHVDYSIHITMPNNNELHDLLTNSNSYEAAQSLQDILIIQLINKISNDDFVNKNITDPEVKNNTELDIFGMINHFVQTIINSHYFDKDDMGYVLLKLNAGSQFNIIDNYHNVITGIYKIFQENKGVSFKLQTDDPNDISQTRTQFVINEITNRYTQFQQAQATNNSKLFIKLVIEAILFSQYMENINESPVIDTFMFDQSIMHENTLNLIQYIADFIYYSQPKEIRYHLDY